MAQLAEWLGSAGIACDRYDAVSGSLAHVLEHQAGVATADLVVVGAHEVEGATALGLGLGSVAHGLCHRLACPVVSVPDFDQSLVGATFVVGIDGSPFSRKALEWTATLARRLHGSCCAVYVIDGVYDTFDSAGWYGSDERDAARLADVNSPGVEFVERTSWDAAATLQEVAAERNASLIVVAAKGRGGMHGLLLGPIPDRLLHRRRSSRTEDLRLCSVVHAIETLADYRGGGIELDLEVSAPCPSRRWLGALCVTLRLQRLGTAMSPGACIAAGAGVQFSHR